MPDESDPQELGRELYAKLRALGNVERNRGQLATESIEDVAAQRARLQKALNDIKDIAAHARGRDVSARIEAIRRIASGE